MDVLFLGLNFLCLLPLAELETIVEDPISDATIQEWIDRLGPELWIFADLVTRRKQVQDSFREAKVEIRDGSKLADEIAKELSIMMDSKMKAIERIMDVAEAAAEEANNSGESDLTDYKYFNAKMLDAETVKDDPKIYSYDAELESKETESDYRTGMTLRPNKHFGGVAVNTTHSAVHVPTNIFDRSDNVLPAIKWSERLEPTFKYNYQKDPTMSWQYFGSSAGFMRFYPAKAWTMDPVDLYDCRTRSWYVEAATSPKDVLILVDNSGSMTGERKQIARHVVNNILDTLGNNDYVNILSFIADTEEVVPCFKDQLVQANLGNIRQLKIGMEEMEAAKNIANFKTALINAFEILRAHTRDGLGAMCNQAIMLITDGVPYNYKEIFEKYNWEEKPKMPVRVFTYLIGREASEVREVKWMACANRGYYVHLSTTAEVQEQVLQYVPVMARPMVLQRNDHPIIWSPVYADITDPRMTDWLWEQNERKEQRERSLIYKEYKDEEHDLDRRYVIVKKNVRDHAPSEFRRYRLMASVSIPVYDRREKANVSEQVLVNEAYWVVQTRETEVAYLLGVAGTDIPIEDIEKVLKPQVLGLNAYAFIITNNGYILTHPDLRPVFQGILKPSYNSVDLTDVELVDDDSYARSFSPELIKLRQEIVMQKSDQKTLRVKYHYDGMRRAATGRRHYFYRPIKDTPFTLVVVLPNQPELYRVSGQTEIKRVLVKANLQGNVLLGYFEGNYWRVHPNWTYCKYSFEDPVPFDSNEDEIRHFLNKTSQQGWYWPSKLTEHHANSSATKSEKSVNDIVKKDLYFCERALLQSLVFDVIATKWFNTSVTGSFDEKRQDFKKRFGLVTVFMATRSGLTRWQDFPASGDDNGKPHGYELPFGDRYNRAVDEIWYKRAVDQHYVNHESFVYAVPFYKEEDDEKNKTNNILVTASHAVFHTDRGKSAPAAVVGLQFRHSALHNFFLNITSTCKTDKCNLTCDSPDLHCYILDNNAYIIVSEDVKHTGKFFGQLHGEVMDRMVDDKIYKKIRIYDYQAVCFRVKKCGEGNTSSRLLTPLHYFGWLVNWVLGNVFWLLLQTNIQWLGSYAVNYPSDEVPEFSEPEEECEETIAEADRKQGPLYASAIINETRPQPCDKEMDLYQLEPEHQRSLRHPFQPPGSSSSCKRSFKVKNIPHTNLVLVVINRLCKKERYKKLSVHPDEVRYNDTMNCTGKDCDTHKLACYKLYFNNFTRNRPSKCLKYHPGEVNITDLCGNAALNKPFMWFIIFMTILRWSL